MAYQLRPHQEKAIDLARASIRAWKKSPCIVMPTGAGKSLTSVAMMESAIQKGVKSLFITPRRALTYQIADTTRSHGIRTGIYMNGEIWDSSSDITAASIDTIIARQSRHKELFDRFKLIMIDEAHLFTSEKRADFIKTAKASGCTVVSMTATPVAPDGGGLGDIADDLVIPVTMKELIEQGYLLQPEYYSIDITDTSNLKMAGGEYTMKSLKEAYGDCIYGDVYKNWQEIAGDKSTVVFAPVRTVAAGLMREFESKGVSCAYLDAHSTDEERSSVFDGVQTGKIQCIFNVGIVSLGVDIPRLQCVVMATKTASVAKWMQAVGRTTRPYESQDKCIVIDHGGMAIASDMGPVEDVTEWMLSPREKIRDAIAQRNSKKVREGEPVEIKCHGCGHIFKGAHRCPHCGERAKQRAERLLTVDGKLVKVSGKRKKPSNRDELWIEKLFIARAKGMTVGAAAHMYKKEVGSWPRGVNMMPAGGEWRWDASRFVRKKYEIKRS